MTNILKSDFGSMKFIKNKKIKLQIVTFCPVSRKMSVLTILSMDLCPVTFCPFLYFYSTR